MSSTQGTHHPLRKRNLDLVIRLLTQAAANQPRVLVDPGPTVSLVAFGAHGLDFKLGFWIADQENGSDALKSLINLSILAAFRENGIEIPYPQRVVHMRAPTELVTL